MAAKRVLPPSSSSSSSSKRWINRAVITTQILCGIHLFHTHVCELRPCAGASMYPTLGLHGDYILQSRLLYRLQPLERGTLVTSISPLDPAHHVLKRVIGLPGDTICVDPSGERSRSHRSFNNNSTNPTIILPDDQGQSKGKWNRNGPIPEWITVPKGHVWLAGDNTSNSTDSRDYGPVPIGLIRGKVIARVWPNPRWLSPSMRVVDHP